MLIDEESILKLTINQSENTIKCNAIFITFLGNAWPKRKERRF